MIKVEKFVNLKLLKRRYIDCCKYQLTIGSYVSVRSSRYEARGRFGEHERCVRVAQGVAESNSSFLSAL